jgi:acetyl-CoA C-acetyltransferase
MRKAVIVGVGQYRRNPKLDGPFDPWEPAAMMAEAIRRAVVDAGTQGDDTSATIPGATTLLACVEPMAHGYNDLCARVGELAAINASAEGLTVPPGGNSPGELLNQLANRIVDGEADVAILTGSECVYGRRRAIKESLTLDWTPFEGHRDFLKGQRSLSTPIEARHGIVAPIQCYPFYENALRAQAGRSIEDHQTHLGRFMARNTKVAAANPYAWFPTEYTAEEISTVTPENRWVCFPYPKRMNAIMEVDLSAAIVVMSDAEADRRGIPAANRVAFLGGASAADAWTPAERIDFTSSPAIRAAAKKAFAHAGVGIDDVDLFDLYSCFPSAVQIALNELGVAHDDPRGVTVTGGLAYAGGPGNSYALHGLAAITEQLRDPSNPAKVALVSSLGMTATKHAYNVLSSEASIFAAADGRSTKIVLPPVDVTGPELVDEVSGEGIIETYTVEHDRTGAAVRTMYMVMLSDGRRTVGNGPCTEEEVRTLMTSEGVGLRVKVTAGKAGTEPKDNGTPNLVELL